MSDKQQIDIDAVVGRKDNTFICLDYIFRHGDGMQGATGSRMVPISQEEIDRREEECRDYEWSPLRHIYDEEETPKGWEEWINDQLRYDKLELLVDTSYSYKYRDQIESKVDEDFEVLECIGGGRMFDEESTLDLEWYDEVYDRNLIKLARNAENDKDIFREEVEV